MPLAQAVVCVPGPWSSSTELAVAVGTRTRSDRGFVLVGRVLMEHDTGRRWELDLQARDRRMVKAFEIAGGGLLPRRTLEAIRAHRKVAYVIGATGSVDDGRGEEEEQHDEHDLGGHGELPEVDGHPGQQATDSQGAGRGGRLHVGQKPGTFPRGRSGNPGRWTTVRTRSFHCPSMSPDGLAIEFEVSASRSG